MSTSASTERRRLGPTPSTVQAPPPPASLVDEGDPAVGGIRRQRPHDLRGQVGQVDALGGLLGVLELRREQEVRDDVGHGLGVVDELVDLGQTRAGGWVARGVGREVPTQHLGPRADHGERRAQLV